MENSYTARLGLRLLSLSRRPRSPQISRRSPCRCYAAVSTATTKTTPQSATSQPAPTTRPLITTQEELSRARLYCLNLLRTHDTPSSLLLPYIPPSARDAYIALRALNIDLALAADASSTPTIAAMRLAFYREAITNALSGHPPKQPVAILLAHANSQLRDPRHSYDVEGGGNPGAGTGAGSQRGFSLPFLHRLVSTRERQLSNPPFPTLESLERYAENTYSTLLYLTLQALPFNKGNSLTADHVASHIGKAAGIAAVLRGLPILAFPRSTSTHTTPVAGVSSQRLQGVVTLPLDVMAQAGVREEEVLRKGGEAQGLRDAVFAVATRANDHLRTARSMLASVRRGEGEGHEFEHADEHSSLSTSEEMTSRGAGDGGVAAETPAQELDRAFGVFMPAVATQLWLDRLQKRDFDTFAPALRQTDWRLPWKAYVAWWRRSF